MTDYSKFTDQEIDTALAEMMGWEMVQMTPTSKEYWGVCHFEPMIGLVGHEVIEIANWHPHDDLNQVWQCEDKLLETTTERIYEDCLNFILIMEFGYGKYSTFHAPARQRCIAILMAMEEK